MLIMEGKKLLPIEAIIPGGEKYNTFQPKRMKQLVCAENNFSFFYDKDFHFYQYEGKEWKLVVKHSLDFIQQQTTEELTQETCLHPISRQPGHFWIKKKKEILFIDLLHPHIEKRIEIAEDWECFDYNEASECYAYLFENGLYLLFTNGESQLVYQAADKAITAGQAAARNEFGIEKGTFWSHDGKHLAFFITDQRNVTEYPLVDINAPIATCRNIRYPMAGQASEETTIGIFHLTDKKTNILEKQGTAEDYLCCVAFTPDDQHLIVAELNRNQQQCRLNLFNTENGKYCKTLLTDTDNKYIEPEHAPLFYDDKNFVWQIRRKNYDLPYLYSINGDYNGPLTEIDGDITRIVGYDTSLNLFILETNAGNYNGRRLLSVSPNGEKRELTPIHEATTHKATLLQNGWFIDEVEGSEIPYKAILRRLDDNSHTTLKESPNPLKGYIVPEVELGTIRLNGYDICYRLIKPVNFNPEKTYPMVCYFYGGPHVQLIHTDWNYGTAGFEYMMANDGYFVFTIDPRGSANRGKQFEQEIWRNIGKAQTDDYTKATQWIVEKENHIDKKRIGVYGWSFGGFMATSLMLKANGLYKVGVAGGPVTDWKLYEVMYTERYMQKPQDNLKGYEQNNLCNKLQHLKGRLMLIHCNTDPVVLWQNSLQMLKQAVKNNKQIDYSVYVGHPHNVRGPERVHLMTKIKQYFNEYL